MKLIDNRHASDAAVNLALEEYCFRHLDPSQNYLLFYINEPAVIIGSHQNPWEQVNFHKIHPKKISIFRRMSGGGAVYHDSGNLNVAFITSHKKEPLGHFKPYMRPIMRALSRLGVPDARAHGNAIFFNEKKISGFAQFGNLKRVLTHGTLLFDSDLEALNQTLTTDLAITETKAIASNKKEVTNVLPFLKVPITLNALIRVLTDEISTFFHGMEKVSLPSATWRQVYSLAETKYRKWDWTYGRSPAFVVQETVFQRNLKRSFLLQVTRGRVESVKYLTDKMVPKTHDRLPFSWREAVHRKRYHPRLMYDLLDN